MKKSEIKDLYNQSDSALRMLKAMTLILPYAKGDKTIIEAIDTAAHLVTIVKTMCDYMIDDGSTDMRERLQVIKSEATQIESNVAKMGYSKERFALMLNCRAIINNIKDMEEWTANGVEPQHEVPEAPQQPIEGNDGELAGNGNETRPDESPGDDDSQYINLPLGMQTPDKRAEKILKSAIDNGWMGADENQGTWYGFDKTKDGRRKNYMQSLAYLCGKTYKLSDSNQTQIWGVVEKYFRVCELSKHWGNVIGYERRSGRKQSYQTKIDQLISTALKTP